MSRGRSPLPRAQPTRHWAGLLLSSLEPATCWAGSAARGRARTGEAGTGDRRLPPLRDSPQREPRGSRAAPRSRRSAPRRVFPLSAAPHRPHAACNVQRRGRTRVLTGSYRERRYCGIAERLSPAALSLPSFSPLASCPLPPAPPPPAAAAAADSRRRPPAGRAGSASSLRAAPPPSARPGPLRGTRGSHPAHRDRWAQSPPQLRAQGPLTWA